MYRPADGLGHFLASRPEEMEADDPKRLAVGLHTIGLDNDKIVQRQRADRRAPPRNKRR